MSLYTLSVTGYSPDKLYGYNLKNRRWAKLFKLFQKIIIERRATKAITGMLLGVDTVFAMAVLNLRDRKRYPIQLCCAIPCYNMTDPWISNVDVRRYNQILNCANEVEYVTKGIYTPRCFFKRDQYMINNCDELLAVWDGIHGLPRRIKYAQYKQKPITLLLNQEGELIND